MLIIEINSKRYWKNSDSMLKDLHPLVFSIDLTAKSLNKVNRFKTNSVGLSLLLDLIQACIALANASSAKQKG